jgi:hypothetical protein
MLRSRQTVRWHPASLVLACALLTACASRPQRPGRGDLRLDTESAGKVRHAAAIAKSARPAASVATQTVASTLGKYAPALLTVLESDNAVGELEEQLVGGHFMEMTARIPAGPSKKSTRKR